MDNIKAIVTDLDHTIVDERGRISVATMRAAACLARRQTPLILATERSPAWIMGLDEIVSFVSAAVCCGGGIGWRPRSGVLSWRETISRASVEYILRSLSELPFGVGIAAFNGFSWRVTRDFVDYEHGSLVSGIVDTVSAENIGNEAIYMLYVCRRGHDLWELPLNTLKSSALKTTRLSRNAFAIGPTGFDKGVGVTRFLDEMEIDPAQAIAFGDMLNDLPVFAVCGRRVAMGNAHPDLIAASSVVAPCVHSDGFARTLCKLGIISSDIELDAWNEPECKCQSGSGQTDVTPVVHPDWD